MATSEDDKLKRIGKLFFCIENVCSLSYIFSFLKNDILNCGSTVKCTPPIKKQFWGNKIWILQEIPLIIAQIYTKFLDVLVLQEKIDWKHNNLGE